MTKKIYVGGKWSDRQKIKKKMGELQAVGFQITHDWTTFETDKDGFEKMSVSAQKDIEGIKMCDVMVAYMDDPDYAYRGTFTEIGCALGLDKKVIVVCPFLNKGIGNCKTNCFFHHPKIEHIESWKDLFIKLQIVPNKQNILKQMN